MPPTLLCSEVGRLVAEYVLPWAGLIVWPCMLTVPLVLSQKLSSTSYYNLFPPHWYDDLVAGHRPSPLGLTLGILAVAIGQIFVIAYFYLHSKGYLGKSEVAFNSLWEIKGEEEHDEFRPVSSSGKAKTPPPVQIKGAPLYDYFEGVRMHLAQPEGFVLLVGYLSGTWMLRLMPSSYYSFDGHIQWCRLLLCLVVQDGVQYVMHRLEHSASPAFYRMSHKPHHRFTNPRMFDAFNGSMTDTIVMILIPLYITAWTVRCNVWTYMAFGSIYANWLTLIHCEYPLPWDKFFRRLGLGTPGDHHVHHKFFKYNYGHLFMWFDWAFGTYQNPKNFPKVFSPEV